MADWLSGGGFGAPDPQAGLRQALFERPNSEALAMRKRLACLEARARLQEQGRTPALPLEFTSQYGEDCWLWELFSGQTEGFYIEVGAFDGHTLSVTYPFEAIGWTGLLVEPIAERFEKARARRPRSRVVHAALAGPGSSGTCTFTVVQGEYEGMLSHMTPTGPAQDPWSGNAPSQKVTVPLTTMNDLLGDHAPPIDFAVIDVEGAEIPLLQGFDLLRYRPRVLLIEEGMPAQTTPVMQYLATLPYTPVSYPWINRAYIRNDQAELIDRGRRLPVW